MPFKGFNVKYPEYTIETPQTGLSFNVRSLNVQEEERLKGSLNTPNSIAEHLNKCIYEAMTKKPAQIKTFEDFLSRTTLKDRDAILYGLYHITYEEIRNYDVTCSSCRKEYPVTIQASDTFTFNSYPHKDILKKRHDVPLPITSGVIAVIKQPSLIDEVKATKELGSRPGSSIETIAETMIIDSFKQDVEASKEADIYSDRVDILDAYLTLPSRDKRAIHKAYDEMFGKFGIELKMKSHCIQCGNAEDIDIDLVNQFFRMAYSSTAD
jgi:hypothetical protein